MKKHQGFMKKDFEKWHKKKTDIDNSSKRLFSTNGKCGFAPLA